MSDQKQNVRDVIIIGSGPAGLTAAIYNARADLNPLVIAGIEFGGQLMGTTLVENYPGFKDGIMGPELMNNMVAQAKKYGADFVYKYADKVDFSGELKKVYADGEEYKAKSVIIAVGSSPRKLHIPGEEEFWGKGVSTCATCDAAFYRDKVVAVVGGGDSAMEESNFLTKFAKKVYVVHRRDKFRASQVMQERVLGNDKIEILWDSEVRSVVGKKKVTSLLIENNKTKEESTLEVDGLFLAIGHVPNTKLVEGHIELDEQGYVEVHNETGTSEEGVFVAGDVRDYTYQQAVTAAGMGCKAALDAERWLQEKEMELKR
jgi:thioredoxin reductase (NADPH)